MLYFAYGSNMSRALMRVHCPHAQALGRAVLDGWRFLVMTSGYASIAPARGGRVHGVLWRVTPRDLAALNTYESVDSGLYRSRRLPVRANGRRVSALVYIGRSCTAGTPKPGYLELVLDAARAWTLPADYVADLARWSPGGLRAGRVRETGEIA
jgi:cation transport regulator ChaC